ncbi:MAG TPA: hypothetical protein VJ972_01340 [Anaerolineales bacterium]|nr:hypothetical protein [Anaerolineales bacterium]
MKKLFPRIQDVLLATLFFSASLQGASMLNTDGDIGRHITIGNYILENKTIPAQDIFSHTMTGERLVPHEWIAQLLFAGVHKLAGLNGVVLLVSLVIALTFTLTFREMLKKDIFRIVAFPITILAAFASNLHWLTRPHVFTFLFVAIWTYQIGNKSAKWWLFPIIMVVWANTHGAFIAGFAIWFAFFAGWLWDYLLHQETKARGIRLLTIGISSLAVTFINPVGWRLWDTSVGYFGSRFLVDKTIEYQSPDFHISSTWPFLIMLILFLMANGFKGKLKSHETFLLIGWGALGLYNARNIPIFAIVTAPYLAYLIQENLKNAGALIRIEQNLASIEQGLKMYGFNLIAIILIMATTLQNSGTTNRFNPRAFPVDAANWLDENPQEGNMFNFFTWGGFLLYRLWPEQKVFIDGQTDFYGEALSREYVQVETLQDGWENTLAKYNVDWVITQSGQPLEKALTAINWTVIYQDETTAILSAP